MLQQELSTMKNLQGHSGDCAASRRSTRNHNTRTTSIPTANVCTSVLYLDNKSSYLDNKSSYLDNKSSIIVYPKY